MKIAVVKFNCGRADMKAEVWSSQGRRAMCGEGVRKKNANFYKQSTSRGRERERGRARASEKPEKE